MKTGERVTAAALISLLLVLWLGFVRHSSPRFAGSLAGGLLAVAGTLFMLVPLVYSIIKRVGPLKRRVTKRVGMATLLTIHVYAGLVGPILVLLHTGHKFDSFIGIALTAMTLIVATSGYVGRYLMTRVGRHIGEQKRLLAGLEAQYRYYTAELAARPEQQALVRRYAHWWSRLTARASDGDLVVPARVVEVTHSMAEVEASINAHESFKRLFTGWLKLHLVLSFILYTILALHIYAALHFGIRWFR